MSDVLHVETLLDLAGDEVDTFLPIVEDFQENGTQLLQQITTCVAASDLAGIRAAAHQLKGSSGMLGMTLLYEQCQEIEHRELSAISPDFTSALQSTFQRSVQLAMETLHHA